MIIKNQSLVSSFTFNKSHVAHCTEWPTNTWQYSLGQRSYLKRREYAAVRPHSTRVRVQIKSQSYAEQQSLSGSFKLDWQCWWWWSAAGRVEWTHMILCPHWNKENGQRKRELRGREGSCSKVSNWREYRSKKYVLIQGQLNGDQPQPVTKLKKNFT